MRVLLTICLLVSFLNAYADNISDTDPVAVLPPNGLVPENFILINSSESHPKHVFIADKDKRTLTVWANTQEGTSFLGAYPMDIGKNHGDKLAAGDHRTPEGIYFIQEKLEGSSLDFNEYGKRAFTLDYPNFFDQRIGKTGNGIWLHAVPETKSLKRGSRGCVVVRNEIIDRLTPLINPLSTPVLILDKVNYIKPDGLAENRKVLENWLQNWRAAWESKNIDAYMANYSENFKAMKMTKNLWRRYKESLNEKYKYIKVSLKEPLFVGRKDEAIIRFIQDYDSDGLKDIGEKTLYVKKTAADKFEILAEVWKPLRQDLLAHKQIQTQEQRE